MLGEIDLSVGSMSGLSSAILGVLWVNNGFPFVVAIIAAIASGGHRDRVHALLYNSGWECQASWRRLPARWRCSACTHPRPEWQHQPSLCFLARPLRPDPGDARLAVLSARSFQAP